MLYNFLNNLIVAKSTLRTLSFNCKVLKTLFFASNKVYKALRVFIIYIASYILL